MNYEQAQGQLMALSGSLREAADRQQWQLVSELHSRLQLQLQDLFGQPELPADGRPAQLLSHIQQLSEDLAVSVKETRDICAAEIDQRRRRRRGMSLYQETAQESA
ncbi:MAG: hypothetical protein AAGB27_01515 [Pseudomonadota bacterium]